LTGRSNIPSNDGDVVVRALADVLHQDPDIIALGEITTDEAVEELLESALMGHKVFSTLHAEDTASALLRLQNVSAAAPFLASSSIVILAERLVRKICTSCSEVCVPRLELVNQFHVRGFDPDTVDFRHGTGCAECLGSGFRGRTGIFELLVGGPEMREVLLMKRTSREIRQIVMQNPEFLPLKQAGFLKAVEGTTTLEEVLRVIPPVEEEMLEDSRDNLASLCRKAGLRWAGATEGEINNVAPTQPQKES